MKGSENWGKGPPLRMPMAAVIVVVLAVTAVGVYYFYTQQSALVTESAGEVTTVTTTGIGCADAALPEGPDAIEGTPLFANLSAGLCYNYMGSTPSTATFAYYNGSVSYPCGDNPLQTPASQILIYLDGSGAPTSGELIPNPQSDVPGGCDPSLPLWVVTVSDVESTIPAVPQLNVTLAVPAGGQPVSGLRAVLTLDGGAQTFLFGGVTRANPLSPGSAASSTQIILTGLNFSSDKVYPMAVSGTLADGTPFSEHVHVQIENVP